MKDGLPRFASVIDHHSISVFFQTFLRGNGFCNKEEVADELPVGDCNTMDVLNMLFRNNQRVRRRLGIDILECQGKVVLVNDLGGNLFFDDLAEKAVRIRAHGVLPIGNYSGQNY